jgi:hypothetical protein
MIDNTPFIKLVKHPLKFRAFLLGNIPSAYFAGIRIREMDGTCCTVSVPYKWFSRNPFRSIYFACLAMAGEMSTGALGMSYLYKRKPSVAMLVVSVHADYLKKATGKTVFVCEDGDLFRRSIEQAIETGEPQLVKARSTGRDSNGEIVAEMIVTWSFKRRK